MPLSPPVKKSMPALGKFGIWLGISTVTAHLTSNPELATALATAGVGVANLDAACVIINGITANRLSDYYKDFRSHANSGINHNLHEALQNGLANALHKLEKTFLAENTLPTHERQQISLFFQSLAHHLGTEINADEQVNDYVLDRAVFFHGLLKPALNPPTGSDPDPADTTVLMPDLTDQTAERLVTFLLDRMEPVAQRFINEEFKTNDKAKTAYFIHLLEYGARTNLANHERLIEISQSLDDIGKAQQEHTDLLRHIAQAQQRIYDGQRTLNLDFRAYVSEFDGFRERVNRQLEPSLRLSYNYEHLSNSFSYQYVQRYTSFISRDAEIDQLWRFLNDRPDQKMAWWLVTGPGGMGKSRLALEFCLEAQCVNRYVGFVESDHIAGFDWSQWQPAHPTLLVVDYVAAYAEPTRKMIAQLTRNANDKQQKQMPNPVRVLLLERETRNDWWRPFLTDRDLMDSWYVPGQPEQVLNLPAFSDADRWQIIIEIHRKQQKPIPLNQAETLQSLATIDPDGRPLFAFLAGMAMAEGQDIRRWDVHDLLDNLLEREKDKVWKTHPNWADERCREGHQNLLLLTTLTRGLNVSQLKELLRNPLPYLPDRKPDASLYERLSDIRKRELPNGTEENVYEGLQPDLVGEYYVLKRIEQLLTDDFTGEETVQALLQFTWDITPKEIWWSISRTLSDFGHFPNRTVRQYLESSCPLTTAPETAWLYWSNLRFNLMNDRAIQGDMSTAQAYYQDLKTLAQAYPHDQAIAFRQAMGALNLTSYYGEQGNMSMAHVHYQDLQVLADNHADNQGILLVQAMGATNLTNDSSKQGEVTKAQSYYENLKTLAKASPQNKEIAFEQAKGAYALTTYAPTAQVYYEDLRTLAQAHPDKEEIAFLQGSGAVGLTKDYGEQGNMAMAQVFYQDLQKLAQVYPHNEKIMLQLAVGEYNMITYYGIEGDIPMAQVHYEDLKTLTRAYPHNEEIASWQAMGAMNLTSYYSVQANTTMAQIHYRDLQLLAKKYVGNQAILLSLAKGATNLTTYHSEQGDIVMAKVCYQNMKTIVQTYPHNEEIALRQANGAVSLINYYSRQRNVTMAQFIYADLQTLTGIFSYNGEIVLRQAMGAGSQLNSTSKVDKLKHKPYFLNLLSKLEELLNEYAETESWQERLHVLLHSRDANQWLKS